MLKREQDAILGAVSTQWNVLSDRVNRNHEADKKAIKDRFKSAPAVIELAASLKAAGCSNPDESAWNIILGNLTPGFGASRISWTSDSVINKINDSLLALPKPTTVQFYVDESYGLLNIALSTCNLKWPALQPHVYVLMAELSGAKTYDDLRRTVIAFTTAIAS